MKFFTLLPILFYLIFVIVGCSNPEGPEETQGFLEIIVEIPSQMDSTTAIDSVHCTVKKGGSTVWEDDLTQEGQYFTADIKLDAGSGYSVYVECYENNQKTYFGGQSGITISGGETTTVNVSLMEIEWEKTFGGSHYDCGESVQQTSDGGYIIAGNTSSYGAGDYDVYLIKTDANGNEQWSKTFGGSYSDYSRSVQQTTDGGYIIAGSTSSYGAGSYDAYLIKTDVNGNESWSKTFGGSDYDYGESVQQTSDGGYIIAGYTLSYGAGGGDVYLIKTDANGNEQWSQTFGGSNYDGGYSVQQTTDGGYIIAGTTGSYVGGIWYVYLIKTYTNGNQKWYKTFGGSDPNYGYSVQQTSDGGYIIAGWTYSYGAIGSDVYLIKTDANGNQQWHKIIGGNDNNYGNSIQQTNDGGYILAGGTCSSDTLSSDVYLIKVRVNQ
ncbi:MAG: PQQ-like beta-propeller repeat protein [candidate division Zixibacteria bacterium]|nr:PQQ-like beta-propeller repeat protein [Candidatus Tariuqbacter arcticus]